MIVLYVAVAIYILLREIQSLIITRLPLINVYYGGVVQLGMRTSAPPNYTQLYYRAIVLSL